MKKTEIQDKLKYIAQNIDGENFIYDFLLSFGLSKTTITRLKKGDYNLSKKEGELFYKGKIFFKIEKSDDLLHTIDEISKDEKIARQKPRFLFVTDFEKGVAIDTKKSLNKVFDLKDLGELEQVDFFLPLSGAEIYRVSNNNKADRDAAYKLGELYDLLVKENPEWVEKGSHHLNLFLSRLLFCFFAEDTGIFDTKNVFTEAMVNNTKPDGSDMHEFLDALFTKLDSNPDKKITFPDYLSGFPYVNGGLFRDTIECPKFSKKARQMLIDAGELEWADINPDIFGSMIQAVADPEERNNLGMHYTSVINILKLIKPLFLDELYEEFEKNKDNARELNKLLVRMSKIKFFDPACGSGNFLIITYKELRNLEIQIIKQLLDLGENRLFFTEISLTQFYGIEIKDFAHEMAILSLWLAEHQMNQVFETELLDFGQSKPILPLKEAGNIVAGNAARMDWENVCQKNDGDEIYIIGNPPYLGSRNQDPEQKSDLELVFKKDYKSLDYVSIWFYKGAKYIEGINAQLALVSTNSVCQGEQIVLTWQRILNDKVEIGFAYQSFKWTNNAKGNAGVTVIIVGLRNVSAKPKLLFTDAVAKESKNINPYLLDAPNVFVTGNVKSISNLPLMIYGNMPLEGGFLRFSEEEKKEVFQFYGIEKFIRKVIGGEEFLKGQNRYCFWIEDDELKEALQFDEIKKRIALVENFRINGGEVARTLSKRSHQFRYRHMPRQQQFIIPCTSSESRDYIPIGVFEKNYVSLNSVQSVYDAEPWLFGVLHSKMHMVWVDAVGGKLETRYRYSAKLCYNTFPFPTLNEKQKESITQYVFSVLDERAKFPEKTMAWLYNPETMPSGLKQAHHELDLAIERIYRLAPFNSDEERLAYLFKLYEEMTTKENLFAKEKKTRKKK
ncbi:class I SAM-dependent DNA methyltransferase [Chryseobacterium sp. POL2]|uniref:class I SAM-dependent DNA methyltransferase n=1 Tax=Chryseobacterium sp. POL2 TaxID=2713414 RepID=UPI0013E1B987|nr:DNA methyltransferase [Chryseobacterium sp. POL2]QIG88243.1 class I SAM-dependent DNA methyltransferase [Chryseobacterium sp. POL2]